MTKNKISTQTKTSKYTNDVELKLKLLVESILKRKLKELYINGDTERYKRI